MDCWLAMTSAAAFCAGVTQNSFNQPDMMMMPDQELPA
jgi:hypothetical protein